MSARPSSSPPLYVSIVSNNPETLDGLQSYFRSAGVASHCTRAIRDVSMVAPPIAKATVIFPDDFPGGDVLALLNELRRKRPRFVSLLVTRTPQQFESVLDAGRDAHPPIVLPKPSFGWDILDAIRAHAGPTHD